MSKQLIRLYGFTLVELSIVIIIIGFLIAGIAAGQSLVKQAMFNAVIQEFTTHAMEFSTFKTRFGYVPGDLPHASSYFNSAACPSGLFSASGCDGNGDGFINWGGLISESSRSWQHLALAGILTANFTGICTIAPQGAEVGINVPASKFNSKAGYFVHYESNYGLPTNHYLYLGAEVNGFAINGALMEPVDGLFFDNKMDNGKPTTGILIAYDGVAGSGCVDGSDDYDLTLNTTPCILKYQLDK